MAPSLTPGQVKGYLSYLLSTADGSRQLEISVTRGLMDLADAEDVQRFTMAYNRVIAAALCDNAASDRTLTSEHTTI